MKKKLKICIFIDTDIAVRHFIKTGAFQEVEQNHDVIYVFNQDTTSNKPATYTDPYSLNIKKVRFTSVPRKRTGHWFPLYMATVIKQQKGLPNYKGRIKDAKYQNGKKFIWLSYIRSLPFIYDAYKKYKMNSLKIDNSVLNIIKDEKPDIILHPSILQGYYINELIQIKKKLGIPFILLMNSWDNPSAKAVCTGYPSKLVVWGEQSKKHAMTYLKMPLDKLEILGAAQFQIYRDDPKIKRDKLCQIFNVPKNKEIIVYAGAGSGRHETQYLKALDEAIGNKIIKNVHIIYRPHPWRGGLGEGEQNFFSLGLKHVSMDPHMCEYYKQQIINPDRKVFMIDYDISNKLLSLADGLISPLSTMLVEAITKGKPVLVFFPKEYEGNGLDPDEVQFSDFIKQKHIITVLKYEAFTKGLIKLKSIIGNKKISFELKKNSQYFHIIDKVPYNIKLNNLVKKVYSEEKNYIKH